VHGHKPDYLNRAHLDYEVFRATYIDRRRAYSASDTLSPEDQALFQSMLNAKYATPRYVRAEKVPLPPPVILCVHFATLTEHVRHRPLDYFLGPVYAKEAVYCILRKDFYVHVQYRDAATNDAFLKHVLQQRCGLFLFFPLIFLLTLFQCLVI